jgi:galactokinase
MRTVVAATPAPGARLRVHTRRDGRWLAATVDIATTAPGDQHGWAAYVAGVVWALREAGHRVGGGHLVVAGDVPVGAGLSSSASLTCAVAGALLGMDGYDGQPPAPDPTAVALLAQRAENGYVGVPCGIMDQLVAMHGRAGHAVLIDTRSLALEHLPFRPADHDLALVVVNTNAPHRLVDGEYAARRATCQEAATGLGVASLRDLQHPDQLEGLTDEVTRRRAHHVLTENERVLAVADVLRDGRHLRTIGPVLSASHASLRDDYEVSCPELDLAVATSLAAGAHGARMTGSGFGGCAIALVDADRVERLRGAVTEAFAAAGWRSPDVFVASPSGGAGRIGLDGGLPAPS